MDEPAPRRSERPVRPTSPLIVELSQAAEAAQQAASPPVAGRKRRSTGDETPHKGQRRCRQRSSVDDTLETKKDLRSEDVPREVSDDGDEAGSTGSVDSIGTALAKKMEGLSLR